MNNNYLDERELYWTEYYNALHPNGLVLKAGGEPGGTGIMSEKTKQNLKIYDNYHRERSRENIRRRSKDQRNTK
jgi:hypothetical protein